MLVLLAAMGRTNLAIQGSKRLIIDRCTLIVAFALSNFAVPSEKDVPLLWKCLETNGKNECKRIIDPFKSMIFAAISYSNAKSG